MVNSGSPTCYRILLVDDFEPWRQNIRSILQARPDLCLIAEATDGVEAIGKAKDLKPDVVLLDIGLPKLNGIAAASEINKVAPDSKIIVVSQMSDPEIVKKALSNGALGYVWKSDAPTELLTALEEVLIGKIFVSSHIKKTLM